MTPYSRANQDRDCAASRTDGSAGPSAICAFRDGSLSVVDAKSGASGANTGVGGSILWASKAGHVETVFACAHRPGDPNTLATGSYGSNIKVWHTPTMDLKVRCFCLRE